MIDIPLPIEYLFKGLTIFSTLALPAVVAGRAGKNPYYALLLMVPIVNACMIWAFAYAKWPKVDKQA